MFYNLAQQNFSIRTTASKTIRVRRGGHMKEQIGYRAGEDISQQFDQLEFSGAVAASITPSMKQLYLAVLAATLHLVQGQGSCVPGVTCESFNCTTDARCPAVNPPQGPVLLPHPECDKFYKCSNGQACEYDCPANLHFNHVEQACDWPERACCDMNIPCLPQDPCIPGVTCPPTGPSDPPTTVTLPPPTAPTPAPPTAPTPAPPTAPTPVPTAPTPAPPTAPTPAPTGCIPDPLSCNPFEDPNNPTLLPHETNCGQFYKCNLGERCLLSCPLGQHFWPAGGVCERPEVACCNPALCNTSPSQCVDDVRCPLIEDPNFPTTFPFPGNCSRFYKCDLGKRCPVDCWPGTHFSASTGRCEAPDEACCDPAVPCRGATVRSCAPDARCPLNDNPFDPTVLKHADCTRFYKCDNGQACVLECPPGQHFRQDTPTTGSCDWPDLACCDPNIPCTGPNPGVTCRPDSRCPLFDDPNNPLLLPHTSSCTRFYKCTNGLACDLPCLHGHFSEALQRCERPEVACCDPAVPCNVPAYWAYACTNSCSNTRSYSSSYSSSNPSSYSSAYPCSYSSSNPCSYSSSHSQ
uniref:Chitin-binding type-2 domain-containing protein n=1 Tax=Anopheles melas TaxID=34690 RepID=A0A182TQ02_9DIPT